MKKSKSYVKNFAGQRQRLRRQKSAMKTKNTSFCERSRILAAKSSRYRQTDNSSAVKQSFNKFPYASNSLQANLEYFCSHSNDARSQFPNDQHSRNLNVRESRESKEFQIRAKELKNDVTSWDKIIVNPDKLIAESEKLESYKMYFGPILKNGVLVEHMDGYDDCTVFSVLSMDDESFDIKLEAFADFKEARAPLYGFNATATVYPNVSKPNTFPDFNVQEFNLPCGIVPDKDDYTKFHELTEETKHEDELRYLYRLRLLLMAFGVANHFSLYGNAEKMGFKNLEKEPDIKFGEADVMPTRAESRFSESGFTGNAWDNETEKNPISKTIALNGMKIVLMKGHQKNIISRPHRKLTESWTVRGHYRHYASGKVGYVKPYTKGAGKKTAKTYTFA